MEKILELQNLVKQQDELTENRIKQTRVITKLEMALELQNIVNRLQEEALKEREEIK